MCRVQKTHDPHRGVGDRRVVFEHGVFPLSSVDILRNIGFIGTQDYCATGKQINFLPWLKKRPLLRFSDKRPDVRVYETDGNL